MSFEDIKKAHDNGEFLKAQYEIDQLIASDPRQKNIVRNWFLRASIYENVMKAENDPEKRTLLVREIKKAIDKVESLEKDSSAYAQLIGEKKEALWADELNEGVKSYRSGNYERANRYYGNALILKPESVEANLYRAYTCQQLKQYDEALERYNKLIDLNKMDENAYAMYLVCNKENGVSNSDLEQLIDKGLKLYPTNKVLQDQKIRLLSKQRKYDALETLLESYVKKYGADPTYKIQQALNFEDKYINFLDGGNKAGADEYFIKAKNAYESVLGYEDTRFIAHYNLASILSYKANEYAKAVNEMDLATQKTEGAKLTKLVKDNRREALQHMLRAYEIQPENRGIWNALKDFYVLLGEDDKALEFQEKLKK